MAAQKTKNPKNVKVCFIYVPCPTLKVAKQLGHGLLTEKLAACVNILPAGLSIYPWKGKLETAREQVLLVKTTVSKRGKALQYLESHHPYEVPCLAHWQLKGINKPYLKWMLGNLR